MLLDSSLKILWLSDIHFFKKYDDIKVKGELEVYISKFVNFVKLRHLTVGKIDYILITGDLAQQGTTKDYIVFFDMLLRPLLDMFLNAEKENDIAIPLLLTIPGNHDVNWSSTNFFRQYLQRLKTFKGHSERNAFLNDNLKSFKSLFTDYTEFFSITINKIEEGKYSRFNCNSANLEIIPSPEYLESRLYGFVIDKKRKVVFVLMNSAWFSLGSKFNYLLAAQRIFEPKFLHSIKKYLKWKNDNKEKFNSSQAYYLGNDEIISPLVDLEKEDAIHAVRDLYEVMEESLQIKDDISEYNKQVSGINLLAIGELFKEISLRYTDYFILTTMHHPFNWMEWEEQYSYSSTDDNNANRFRSLMSITNLFLTGHEHVPRVLSENKIFENTLHLKAGCFLFDNQHLEVKFENSWFSLLSIDSDSKLFQQEKIFYDKVSESWQVIVRDMELQVKSKFTLTPEKKKMIKGLLNGNRVNKLKEYFRQKQILSTTPADKFKFHSSYNGQFDIIEVSMKERKEIVLLATQNNFYSNVNKNKIFTILDNLIKKDKSKMKVVRFFVLDLFVDNRLSKLYSKSDNQRDDIRDFIFKRGDILFDDFRHNFFIRFERNLELTKMLPTDFNSYDNLQFVNHIIPYWDFEKYWI